MSDLADGFIDGVVNDLGRNKVVNRPLPGGGRLHIDRQRPFLCLYRRPLDCEVPGTDSLLLGQASILIASADPTLSTTLHKLVHGIVRVLVGAFGRIALLEMWSEPLEIDQDDRHIQPLTFRLVAPRQNTPLETLESLERGLLSAHWGGAKPKIVLDYVDAPAPPGLAPILSEQQARKAGCTMLGLGISPHFRDPGTGRVLPLVLNAVRRDLGLALNQGLFAFSHARSTYRPAHFHELGPSALTHEVLELDRQLAAIGDRFDLLLHVTPVNAEAAWQSFSRAGFGREPEFLYRPLPADPSLLKSELYRIPLERIEDPAVHQLCVEKRDELDRQLTLLGDRETRRFLYGSLQLYEAPDQRLTQLAVDILEGVVEDQCDDADRWVNADEFAARAQAEIDHYRALDPSLTARVEIRDDVAGILVSNGNLLISPYTSVANEGVEATLHHEIGTHVLTHHNGLQQPFQQLHAGMAGYEELQEGLAILAEHLVGGLSGSRLRLLAGRVLAVDTLMRGATFLDTFNLLLGQLHFAPRTAYTVAMRVHRGGGYTKDAIYLKGLDRMLAYLRRGRSMKSLLIGKISFDHLELVNELTWRKVLVPPRLLPRYLEEPSVQARLERTSRADSVLALMKDEGRCELG